MTFQCDTSDFAWCVAIRFKSCDSRGLPSFEAKMEAARIASPANIADDCCWRFFQKVLTYFDWKGQNIAWQISWV